MKKLPKKKYSLDKMKLKAYQHLTNEVQAELEEFLEADPDNTKLIYLIEKLSFYITK